MSQRAGSILFVVALLARLLLVATSTGSSDVVYKTVWAKLAAQHGTAHAYAKSPLLNEPPLIIAVSAGLYRYAESIGASFTDLYRLLQVLADVITAFLLIRVAHRANFPNPWLASLIYFASPAVIFISGFHCNADPLLMCLIVASITVFSARPQALIAAGLLLGAATGVKVVALLMLPLFVAVAGRRALYFLAGYALASGAIFGVPAFYGGAAVLTNTFGYQGLGNWWGFVSMVRVAAMQGLIAGETAQQIVSMHALLVRPAIVIGVGAIAFLLLRKQQSIAGLLTASSALFSLIIVLGSGFGVQYLLWPLPFVVFALRREFALAVHAIVSIFLFMIYTSWSRGFPWDFANSDAPGATTTMHVVAGWGVWLTLLAVAIAAMRVIPSVAEREESRRA